MARPAPGGPQPGLAGRSRALTWRSRGGLGGSPRARFRGLGGQQRGALQHPFRGSSGSVPTTALHRAARTARAAQAHCPARRSALAPRVSACARALPPTLRAVLALPGLAAPDPRAPVCASPLSPRARALAEARHARCAHGFSTAQRLSWWCEMRRCSHTKCLGRARALFTVMFTQIV